MSVLEFMIIRSNASLGSPHQMQCSRINDTHKWVWMCKSCRSEHSLIAQMVSSEFDASFYSMYVCSTRFDSVGGSGQVDALNICWLSVVFARRCFAMCVCVAVQDLGHTNLPNRRTETGATAIIIITIIIAIKVRLATYQNTRGVWPKISAVVHEQSSAHTYSPTKRKHLHLRFNSKWCHWHNINLRHLFRGDNRRWIKTYHISVCLFYEIVCICCCRAHHVCKTAKIIIIAWALWPSIRSCSTNTLSDVQTHIDRLLLTICVLTRTY